jgi:predicted ATPase
MPPRVLLTGLPASGKSTLAPLLAQRLGVEVVGEAASDLAAAGLDVGPSSAWETLAAIAVLQMARERSATDGFVADRGSIDVLAYATVLERRRPGPVGNLVAPAVRTIVRQWCETAGYDLVVYHPAPCGPRGAILVAKERQHLSDLAEAFREQLDGLGCRIVVVPMAMTVDERIELVVSALTDTIRRSEADRYIG